MKTEKGEKMHPITFEALLDMAETLKSAGIPWHFHMISPTCCLDESTTRYMLIIENESNGEEAACHFSDRPVAQTHQMALLCYGPDFLKKEKTPSALPTTGEKTPNVDFQEIMRQAKACGTTHTAWHNHHLPPRCKYNPQPGTHCILFENEAAGEALYAYYDQDPTSDLAALEKLLFNE